MSIYFPKLDLSKIKGCGGNRRKSPAYNESRVSSLSQTSFPVKLHQILSKFEVSDKEDIASWNFDGRSLQIRNSDRFIHEVATDPTYGLRQTKYKSFVRQLNIYGFQRINHGPLEGSYRHPWFVRDNIELCKRMTRKQRSSQPTALDEIMEEARKCETSPQSTPRNENLSAADILQEKELHDGEIVIAADIQPLPLNPSNPAPISHRNSSRRFSFFLDQETLDELQRLYDGVASDDVSIANVSEPNVGNFERPQQNARISFVGQHFHYIA